MRSRILHASSLALTSAALSSAALFSGCVTRPATSPTSVSEVAPTPVDSATASPWEKVKASFTSGSKQIASAATPKEQHIKAKDPISLAAPAKKPGSDLYVAAAKIQETKGDYAAAASQYEKALAVDGNDLAALVGYGHLLDRQKKYTEATLYYERATKAHPSSAAAWNDLGLCYSRRAATDKAMLDKSVAALNRAVQLKPDKKLYRNNIAAVLVETGRDQDAFTHLAAAHDPATAHYNLGYLTNQHGRVDAARFHFAEALRLNPQMQAARGFLEQLDQQGRAVAERQPPQYAPRVLHVPSSSERSILAPAAGAKTSSPPMLHQGAVKKVVAAPAGRVEVVEPAPEVKTVSMELPFGDIEDPDVATAVYDEPAVTAGEAVESDIEPAVYEDAPSPEDVLGDAPLPE